MARPAANALIPFWDNLLAKEQASHIIPCSLVLAHNGKDGAAEGGSTYIL
jgi:hypothetical protein